MHAIHGTWHAVTSLALWHALIGHRAWAFIVGVGVVISNVLGLKALGVFGRSDFSVHGTAGPRVSALGQPQHAMFTMTFKNRGSRPVSFFDFEISQPRLKNALRPDGSFNVTAGGQFLRKNREPSRWQALQHADAVYFDERRVDLRPNMSVTEMFDLDAFEVETLQHPRFDWPDQFEPVLEFEDSFGGRYVSDKDGTRAGRYSYPYQAQLNKVAQLNRVPGVRSRKLPLMPRWSRPEEYPPK